MLAFQVHLSVRISMFFVLLLVCFLGVFQTELNKEGWRIRDVGAMLLYLAKRHGIKNTVLGKLLSVVSLVADRERCVDDKSLHFPKSVRGLLDLLDMNDTAAQKTVYICPNKKATKKRGEVVLEETICGYTLRETTDGLVPSYRCELCGNDWGPKIVANDGYHFVTSPVRWIVQTLIGRFGDRITLPKKRTEGLCRQQIFSVYTVYRLYGMNFQV